MFGTVLLGDQLNLDDGFVKIMRGAFSVFWSSGLSVTMPSKTKNQLQDMYNHIHEQVVAEDITKVERKSFVKLKEYIDLIIDSFVQAVYDSDGGLSSIEYSKVKVGNETLEQALVNVGLQFRAYFVDVSNYRDIAKMILGVPVVPTLASGILTASKVPGNVLDYTGINLNGVKDIPGQSFSAVTQLGSAAANTLPNLSSIIPSRVTNLPGALMPSIPAFSRAPVQVS